jgi:hypothetical protein
MHEVRKSVNNGKPVINIGRTSIENFDDRPEDMTPYPGNGDAGASDSIPQYNIYARIGSNQLFLFFLIG